MQRLRAEHHVDVGRARDDRLAFLRGDAAANPDDHLRALALERLEAAEVREHLLLGLLPHGAGIEEDDVGFGIAVALEAHVPGMEQHEVEALMQKTHDICPYSWAIRDKVDVKFSVA